MMRLCCSHAMYWATLYLRALQIVRAAARSVRVPRTTTASSSFHRTRSLRRTTATRSHRSDSTTEWVGITTACTSSVLMQLLHDCSCIWTLWLQSNGFHQTHGLFDHVHAERSPKRHNKSETGGKERHREKRVSESSAPLARATTEKGNKKTSSHDEEFVSSCHAKSSDSSMSDPPPCIVCPVCRCSLHLELIARRRTTKKRRSTRANPLPTASGVSAIRTKQNSYLITIPYYRLPSYKAKRLNVLWWISYM